MQALSRWANRSLTNEVSLHSDFSMERENSSDFEICQKCQISFSGLEWERSIFWAVLNSVAKSIKNQNHYDRYLD